MRTSEGTNSTRDKPTRKVITFPNPTLRKKAKAIKAVNLEVRKIIGEMIETMYAAEPKGIGLAAIQVGIPMQIIVADIGEGPIALINPKMVFHKGKEADKEGCLSLPGIYAEVERWSWVKVVGLNKDGKKVEIEAEGLLARVLQHEIDHLNGILFIDRVKDWDTLEVVEGYPVPEELWKFIEAHATAGSTKSNG